MKWNRKKGLTLAAFLMAFSLAAGIPSEAAENYRIGIGKDQTVTADQTVLLDITVAAPGGTFNTADLTFSYEKDYLTFDQKASTGLDDYTVQEENGKLRLLKYGEKQQDGKVFQLAFHTEKAGTTKVTIDSAQMDVESPGNYPGCTGSRERSGTGHPDPQRQKQVRERNIIIHPAAQMRQQVPEPRQLRLQLLHRRIFSLQRLAIRDR